MNCSKYYDYTTDDLKLELDHLRDKLTCASGLKMSMVLSVRTHAKHLTDLRLEIAEIHTELNKRK